MFKFISMISLELVHFCLTIILLVKIIGSMNTLIAMAAILAASASITYVRMKFNKMLEETIMQTVFVSDTEEDVVQFTG